MMKTIQQWFISRKASVRKELPDVSAMLENLKERPFLRQEDLARIDATHKELTAELKETQSYATKIATDLVSEIEVQRRKLAIISDTLMDALISTDFKGCIKSTNRYVEKVFGYNQDEVLNKHISPICQLGLTEELFRQEAERYMEYVAAYRDEEGSRALNFDRCKALYDTYSGKLSLLLNKVHTYKALTKRGAVINVEVVVNIINPEASCLENVVYIVLIRDVTDKIEALHQVESLRHFQLSLLSSIPNPIFYLDISGKIAGCNKAFVEALEGESTSMFVGRELKDFQPSDVAGRFGTLYNSFIHSNNEGVSITPIDLVSLHSANRLNFIMYYTSITDSRSCYTGMIATLVDMSQLLSVTHLQETLLESIPSPVYYLDSALRHTGCNKAYEKLMGMPRSEIQGHTREELLKEDLQNNAELRELNLFYRNKDFDAYNQSEEVQVYESKAYYRATHSFKDVIVYRTSIKKSNGDFDGIISVVMDITEIKAAQRLQQKLFDSIPNPVFYKDSSLRYVGMNQAYANLFGKTKKDLIGKTFAETIASMASNPEAKRVIARLAALHGRNIQEIIEQTSLKDIELISNPESTTQVVEEFLWDITRKDFREALIYRNGMYDDEGNFTGVIGSVVDVTELKHAARTQRALIDHLPSAVYFLDDDNRITDCNAGYCSLTGLLKSDLIGLEPTAGYLATFEPPPNSVEDSAISLPDISTEDLETVHNLRVTELVVNNAQLKHPRDVLNYRVTIKENGLVQGAVSMYFDVTDIKNATRLAENKERQLQVLVNSSPDLITVDYKDGSNILRNNTATQFYANADTELIQLFDFEHSVLNGKLLAKGQSLKETITLPTSNGCKVFEVFKTQMQGDDEQLRILTVTRDLTEFVAQQEKTDTFTGALNSLDTVVAIFNKEYHILFINWRVYLSFGLDPSTLLDRNVNEVFVGLPDSLIQETWNGTVAVEGKQLIAMCKPIGKDTFVLVITV